MKHWAVKRCRIDSQFLGRDFSCCSRWVRSLIKKSVEVAIALQSFLTPNFLFHPLSKTQSDCFFYGRSYANKKANAFPDQYFKDSYNLIICLITLVIQ
jgi:hypothetical protein